MTRGREILSSYKIHYPLVPTILGLKLSYDMEITETDISLDLTMIGDNSESPAGGRYTWTGGVVLDALLRSHLIQIPHCRVKKKDGKMAITSAW
jgi:hypothetical protein